MQQEFNVNIQLTIFSFDGLGHSWSKLVMRDEATELCVILPFFKFDLKHDGDTSGALNSVVWWCIPHHIFAVLSPFNIIFLNTWNFAGNFALNPALFLNKKILGFGSSDFYRHHGLFTVICVWTVNNI